MVVQAGCAILGFANFVPLVNDPSNGTLKLCLSAFDKRNCSEGTILVTVTVTRWPRPSGSTAHGSRSSSEEFRAKDSLPPCHGCPQCDVNRAAEMLRKGITRILEFTGHDDQGQPVTVTVRIPLNSSVGARTDMAKAATASADVVPPDAWTSVPIWKVGDQWTYRWESPRGSGTRVYEVTSEAIVKGIDCYVVKYSRSED
jgi:hypothetical protein